MQQNYEVPNNLMKSGKVGLKSSHYLKRVSPIGQNSITATATDGGSHTVNLPVEVFCNAKGRTDFKVTIDAAGANLANVIQANTLPLKRIRASVQGVELGMIDNCHKYLNIVWNDQVKQSELKSSNYPKADGTWGTYNGLAVANVAGSTTTAVNSPSARPCGSYSDTDSLAIQSVDERAYVFIGTRTNAEPIIRYSIPNHLFRCSWFELANDLYYGQQVTLEFTFLPLQNLGWKVTDVSSIHTGAAALVIGYTISEFYHYVAIQQDPDAVELVKSKFASGKLEVVSPDIIMNRINFANTSGPQSVQLDYRNTSGGKKPHRLLNVWMAPYHTTETSSTAFEHMGTKAISALDIFVDGHRINDQTLTLSAFEDFKYMLNSGFLDNSPVLSQPIYNYNWYMRTKFHEFDDREVIKNGTLCGLNLDEKAYNIVFECTAARANTYYVFAQVQRVFRISPNGVEEL